MTGAGQTRTGENPFRMDLSLMPSLAKISSDTRHLFNVCEDVHKPRRKNIRLGDINYELALD